MFVRRAKQRSGKHTIVLVEGYRDKDGKVKSRFIKSFGVEEELMKEDPDIFEHLRQQYKDKKEEAKVNIELDLNQKNSREENFLIYGDIWIEKIYEDLGITKCLDKIQKGESIKYSLNNVLKTLVVNRCLLPDSKKAAHEKQERFFGNTNVKLDDIYKGLTVFEQNKKEIVNAIQDNITKKYKRDLSIVFYDVTNVWFECEEDEFRKKGCSKENRKEPIVQIGLFIDRSGLPIGYKLFSGEKLDCTTLVPAFSEIKEKYGTNKVIITADKGLNSGTNLSHIINNGNGYIVSQSIRKADKEFKERVISEEGYVYNSDQSFKIKDFIQERTIRDEEGRAKTIKEKVVCFWSENYQKKEKKERDKILKKIQEMVSKPSLYNQNNHKGAKKYISVKGEKETVLSLNQKKVEADEILDGYYTIITSETLLTNQEIIEKYRGLWRIEESFKVLKTDLEGRPVYVRTKEHIEAHFLICFIALTIMRIIQNLLKYKYSTEKIKSALCKAECCKITSSLLALRSNDDVFVELEQKYGVYLDRANVTLNEMINYRKSVMKTAITTN